MSVESATYVSQLDTALPAHTDVLQQSDSHARLIKSTIKNTFPNFTAAALSASQAQIDAAVAAVVSGSVVAKVVQGTAALPGVAFIGDLNTGLFSPGADQVGIAVNGIAALVFAADKTATFTGNAGVSGTFGATGATAFGATVAVVGAVNFASTLAVVGATTLTGLLTANGGATVAGVLTANTTSHWQPPKGTTAQRPAAPVEAQSRYNTDLKANEVWDGGSWRQAVFAQPIAGGFKNLVIQNGATPNTMIDIDADALDLETTGGVAYRVSNVNLTIDCTLVNGVNALDAGGLANSTWYAVWVIYNPTTDVTAGLLSLSGTAPTMPAGFTAKARFGWYRTNTAANLHRIRQLGKSAQYVLSASVTTVLPVISNAVVGTWSVGTPAYASTSVVNFVPSTAATIKLVATNSDNNATFHGTMVAPNNNYSGAFAASNPKFPPLYCPSSNVTAVTYGEIVLESTNIFVAQEGSRAWLSCLGWEDNI
jgi:hypothetical protein